MTGASLVLLEDAQLAFDCADAADEINDVHGPVPPWLVATFDALTRQRQAQIGGF